MMKGLSSTFHNGLGPFDMLTLEGRSETTLFREWSKQVFHSLEFRKWNSYEDHLFLHSV